MPFGCFSKRSVLQSQHDERLLKLHATKESSNAK